MPPTDTAVTLGGIATFNCSARGTPPPIIRWFHDNTQVGEGQTLTLEGVSADDAGTYTCRAINKAGEAVALAQLSIFGKRSYI